MQKTRSFALEAILTGGLIAALGDGLDAVLFYGYYGLSASRLFQGIASGLLGRTRALNGGTWAVLLGILCHMTVAIGAAAFFYAAATFIPLLWQKAWLTGPAFGIGLYLFMQWVVIPLSAITRRHSPMPPIELIDQLFSHMFFVGLPIALATRAAKRKAEKADIPTNNGVESTAARFGTADLRREP